MTILLSTSSSIECVCNYQLVIDHNNDIHENISLLKK